MSADLLSDVCDACGLNLLSGDKDELARLAAEHAELHASEGVAP